MERIIGYMIGLYKKAVDNVPILKYSWVIVAAISLMVISQYFKLGNPQVFLYALGLLAISLVAFATSLFVKSQDIYTKFLMRILTTAIIITVCIGVLSFAVFIISGGEKPLVLKTWLHTDEQKIEEEKKEREREAAVVEKVVKACYKRAVFTSTNAEINVNDMFLALEDTYKGLEYLPVELRDSVDSKHVANILGSLDSIERINKKVVAEVGRWRDGGGAVEWSAAREIDTQKLYLITQIKQLAQRHKLNYIIPEQLPFYGNDELKEANQPPKFDPEDLNDTLNYKRRGY
jgi:hypothetical protein